MIGSSPIGIFINTNNTIYVAGQTNYKVLIWLEGNINPAIVISLSFNSTPSIFVTMIGNIYVADGVNYQVDKWTPNSTKSTIAMSAVDSCVGLFIDINNNLYCSMSSLAQVVMKSLISDINTPTMVAGTGCKGSASDTLNKPIGIFVDINLNLYVADSANNRIQMFPVGARNGITRAGNGASGTIILAGPSGIALDADGYLFIVDQNNNRLVGSDANGFRCLVGCSNSLGSASNQLYYPSTLSFNSYGDIFVTDTYNNRIQKFLLVTNSCSKCNNL